MEREICPCKMTGVTDIRYIEKRIYGRYISAGRASAGRATQLLCRNFCFSWPEFSELLYPTGFKNGFARRTQFLFLYFTHTVVLHMRDATSKQLAGCMLCHFPLAGIMLINVVCSPLPLEFSPCLSAKE